ncbi:UTP--glucose-1-phosphate uridylyltransferase GalU [Balneatrix alpica]|uniref:UTP--glucose-1-phosphate uridylyltransferase GalU n=1 Tax=Balneatrix alpica TaxID=75684 RepID=UPI00273944AA|nr:UTP--glucose-1-phosphate uridylyltransferase GalU [Balneatrix alpica]
MKVRKAIFPVAGLGTRFLPATKAVAKEMLPVVDKPLVQYAVEEAVRAGVRDIIFVTSSFKESIADHFDYNAGLEDQLRDGGKHDLLKLVQEVIPEGVSFAFIRQPKPLGLGHAVLCARPLVGYEPVAVILPDDLIYNEGRGTLSEMIELADQYHQSMVAVEKVPMAQVSKYGVIAPEHLEPRVSKVTSIVEKPPVEEAPSDLAVVGRYVLTPRIFELLETQAPGAGGEIQLTDAIARLIGEEGVMAYEFPGIRYDCGSKLGYLKANVEFGLRHPELGKGFGAYLKELQQ